MSDNYQAGVCNIGTEEIKRRKFFGWFWLIISIAAWLFLILTKVPTIWRLFLFIPVTLSAVGFLQAQEKFCAGFGISGVYNFNSLGEKEKIIAKESIEKDRAKSLKIIVESVIIGILATFVAYFTFLFQ